MSPDDPRREAAPDPRQYATTKNLGARMAIHRRFSTAKVGWHGFAFDAMALRPGEAVLEVGCGPAALWVANADRVPPGCRLHLTDASEGMVSAAKSALLRTPLSPRFSVMDAASLDVPDASVDVVIANHMLYHVADRPKAIAEFRRVLRRDGRLVASTVGTGHMREVDAIGDACLPRSGRPDLAAAFGLETGGDPLRAAFSEVECLRHEDALEVTEADPLVAYVLSLPWHQDARPDEVRRLEAHVRDLLRANGVIHVTKDTGLFLARGARGARGVR